MLTCARSLKLNVFTKKQQQKKTTTKKQQQKTNLEYDMKALV